MSKKLPTSSFSLFFGNRLTPLMIRDNLWIGDDSTVQASFTLMNNKRFKRKNRNRSYRKKRFLKNPLTPRSLHFRPFIPQRMTTRITTRKIPAATISIEAVPVAIVFLRRPGVLNNCWGIILLSGNLLAIVPCNKLAFNLARHKSHKIWIDIMTRNHYFHPLLA